MHDASSRSHAIIKLRLRVSTAEGDQRQGRGLKGTEAIVSLVDLAGSERASETKQVTKTEKHLYEDGRFWSRPSERIV